VDVAIGKTVFSYDRGGKHHQKANEYVLKSKRIHQIEMEIDIENIVQPERDSQGLSRPKTYSPGPDRPVLDQPGYIHPDIDLPGKDRSEKGRNGYEKRKYANNGTNESGMNKNEKNSSDFMMTYSIKVLAYNRPHSLQRLLVSLLNAKYLSFNISIDILVDGCKGTDCSDVEEVKLSLSVNTLCIHVYMCMVNVFIY
jgi:hypothetical protein